MCPQLSLQEIMGVGTPTAWQVKVTVEPWAAWMDSGGLITDGGAVSCQADKNVFNHMINVQKGCNVTGIWGSGKVHQCLTNDSLLWTISFKFSQTATTSKALHLSCASRVWFHSKLDTAIKGRSVQRHVDREDQSVHEGQTESRAAGVRLTAAILIRAVGTVRLFIALVTGWDAGAISLTLELLRATFVIRTLGCCNNKKTGDDQHLLSHFKQQET